MKIFLGEPPANIKQFIIDHYAQAPQPSELTIPLYFEGQEAGATVAMKAWNQDSEQTEEHLQCYLQCSIDGMTTWQTYDGETIQLDNCTNNRVYFRAPVGQPNTNGFAYYDEDADMVMLWHSFKLDKSVKAGGNIQFLLESTGTRTDVPAYAFYKMFGMSSWDEETGDEIYWCASLTQAPALPAQTLADYCYSGMFNCCTSLVHAPELLAEILAEECYTSMFFGCTSLASMDVSFTAWNPANATIYWMYNAGTQATGTKTFTCPSGLPANPGNNGIPSGWTRVDKTS